MSISNIKKIQFTTVKDAKQPVIDAIHELGGVEIEKHIDTQGHQEQDQKSEQEESTSQIWKTSLQFALDFLEPYKPEEKKSFFEKLQTKKQELTRQELKTLESTVDYKKIIGELEELEKQLNTHKNTISQEKKEQATLEQWKELPVIEEDLMQYTSAEIGSIPITRHEDFKEQKNSLELFYTIMISESDREAHYLFLYAKTKREQVKELLDAVEFKVASINITEPIEGQIEQHKNTIADAEQKMHQVEQKIQSYTKHCKDLEALYDLLSWRVEQEEAMSKAMSTRETVSFIAWIPQHVIKTLHEKISSITDKYSIEEKDIHEDEKVPVALVNNKIITPFESVTEVYGVPLHNEPDPTLLLAPFFFVYFAFCLSDVAYGLMLAGLSYLALKVMKPTGMSRKLMILMIFCGGAAVIAGALFGGWFGIDLTIIPGPIGNAMRSMQVLNPVQDPMTVLLVAFVLGYIQLVAGNIIDLVWKIQHGQAKNGLLTSGMWTLFLLAIGFWIMAMVGVLSSWLSTLANYTVLIVLIGMIFTQGYEKKNVFAKLGFGVASLYGLVGYLSDVLSYSRLLALGLSTGIIAMVVNMVASLFGGMIPYIGWLVFILILVGGHLFNLVVSALGAFIHSGRLQYVEFFPKFLEGGGRKFKPLVKTSKYIQLKHK